MDTWYLVTEDLTKAEACAKLHGSKVELAENQYEKKKEANHGQAEDQRASEPEDDQGSVEAIDGICSPSSTQGLKHQW